MVMALSLRFSSLALRWRFLRLVSSWACKKYDKLYFWPRPNPTKLFAAVNYGFSLSAGVCH
jgi:hypothetical protein